MTVHIGLVPFIIENNGNEVKDSVSHSTTNPKPTKSSKPHNQNE